MGVYSHGVWVKVYGQETSYSSVDLLFAFPEEQWTDALMKETLDNFKEAGTTNVLIERVEQIYPKE